MPRNYMGPSPKNPNSRVDGGIGSPNGKQNVDPVYRMQGFQEEKTARAAAMSAPKKPTSNRGRKPDLPPTPPVYPTPRKLT